MAVEMDPHWPAMQELGKAYLERSPDGAGHLEVGFSKSLAMISSEARLTTADLADITHPVLVVVGDGDFGTLPHNGKGPQDTPRTACPTGLIPEVSTDGAAKRRAGGPHCSFGGRQLTYPTGIHLVVVFFQIVRVLIHVG
jgi:hypothetical protein